MLLNIDYFQSVYSVCRFFWIRLSTLFFYLIFFIMLIPVKPGVRFREIGEVINRHALMSGFSVVTYNPRTLFSLYIHKCRCMCMNAYISEVYHHFSLSCNNRWNQFAVMALESSSIVHQTYLITQVSSINQNINIELTLLLWNII